MYRKLSGWLKCSLIHWAGVSRGGSMPWITTRHSLSIAPLPLVNASGTNSCNKSPRVRSSPASKKQERVVAWNGNRSFCPRVSRFARGLLRNIVEPLFRGRPSGPWQVSQKLMEVWLGLLNKSPTNKILKSFILPRNLLQSLFQAAR